MNESEEQYESVRRVLVLKRYENPPPGYFNHFSDRVIARIESETVVIEGSWWRRLALAFDAKPIVAGAYSMGLGGLLFVGLSLVHVYEQEKVENQAAANPWTVPAPVETVAASTQLAGSSLPVTTQTTSGTGVSPMISDRVPSELFQTPSFNSPQFRNSLQPASW